MGMCRRFWGLLSGCSLGISFTLIGPSTFDELHKQPYDSPETFLLLLLQKCDKAAVHFGKNLRNTIPPSGSSGVRPCFIDQTGVHQPVQQDSPTHLLGSVYASKRLATIGGCKKQTMRQLGIAQPANKTERLLGIEGQQSN
jgi:hypothetical protein